MVRETLIGLGYRGMRGEYYRLRAARSTGASRQRPADFQAGWHAEAAEE
jgi:hypothetical protein